MIMKKRKMKKKKKKMRKKMMMKMMTIFYDKVNQVMVLTFVDYHSLYLSFSQSFSPDFVVAVVVVAAYDVPAAAAVLAAVAYVITVFQHIVAVQFLLLLKRYHLNQFVM